MTEQQNIAQMQQLIQMEAQRQLQQQADNEIDLRELFAVIWQGKWTIIGTTFIAAVIAVVYALSLPNIYKSTVLLAPAEESKGGGMAAVASQFGGLASMAGINLGAKDTDKTTIALETLKSHAFITEFVKEHGLKAVIMATNGWQLAENQLTYDDDIYDSQTNTWLRKVDTPKKPEPSAIEVHEYFIKEMLAVNKDKETGLVKVSIKHYSPYMAKDIVDKLVVAINEQAKNADIASASKSINYLKNALNETPIADMQKIFYQLIEQQEQTKMLANVREQYVLKIISPSVVAERNDSPRRTLMCVLGVIIGGMLGVFITLIRGFISKKSL